MSRIRKKYSFFIFCFFYAGLTTIFAQSHLYLKPHFNALLPTCYVKDNTYGHSSFGVNRFNMTGNLGLMLEFDLNDKWGFSLGITQSEIGYDFQFRVPRVFRASNSTGLDMSRFPILVHYTWKDIHFLPLSGRRFSDKMPSKYRNPFLMLFKVQFVGGLSFDGKITDRGEGELQTVTPFISYNGQVIDTYTHTSTFYVKNKVGISAIAGISLQFHSFGKDRFQLSFLYQQGLLKRIGVPIQYSIFGQEYFSQVGSRGSGIVIQMSYPIRLASFKNKNKVYVDEIEIGGEE